MVVAVSQTYNKHKIAEELFATACGGKYYGNALYVALDIPCIRESKNELEAIQRALDFRSIPGDSDLLKSAALILFLDKSPQ